MWWPPANSGTTTIPFRYVVNNDVDWQLWHRQMEAGRNSWNNSAARVEFVINSSSNNIATARSLPNGLYGLMTMGSGINYTFSIQLNTNTIPDSPIPLTDMIARVMAHELGHVMGLEDNPSDNSGRRIDSVMNSVSFIPEWNHIAPTSFDVESANMIYR